MPILILIGGLIVVRICARIMEEWGQKIRAFVSTVLASLLGVWALSLDVNSFENTFNAILVVPALLGGGASFIAITIGWTSDGGIWSESFSSGGTSYGRTTGRMSLTAMIFLTIVAATVIFFVVFAFGGYASIIIYFVFQAILLLIGLFKKD